MSINIRICTTLPTKPEVDDISQRTLRRTEPWPQAACKNLVKFGHVVFKLCKQTDKQTHRHTYRNASRKKFYIVSCSRHSFSLNININSSFCFCWYCRQKAINRTKDGENSRDVNALSVFETPTSWNGHVQSEASAPASAEHESTNETKPIVADTAGNGITPTNN